METKKTTRKEAHAEGIKFLTEAFEAADQAEACFRNTHTNGSIEGKTWGHRLSYRDVVRCLESALVSAKEATCDDCGQLIADCSCEWSNKEV